MEILLNGKPLDYEVETESTVGDVIDYVSKWLLNQGAVIISARLDGKLFDFMEDKPARGSLIGEHERLEVESQNARLLVIETINELAQYLDRVARLAPGLTEKEITAEAIDQLQEGLWWCEDVFKRVEEILRISYRDIEFEGERLHKRLLRLGDIRDHINEAFKSSNIPALNGLLRESVAPLCDALVRSIPVILEKGELRYPGEELLEDLADLLPVIKGMPDVLEAIAIKISIGDSAKGMEEFAAAITSLERAFVLVDRSRKELSISAEDLVMDGKTFDERNEALSGILNELIEAFERKDRVLIGDLIEYEIAPVTDSLAKIMEKIENSLKGSCH